MTASGRFLVRSVVSPGNDAPVIALLHLVAQPLGRSLIQRSGHDTVLNAFFAEID